MQHIIPERRTVAAIEHTGEGYQQIPGLHIPDIPQLQLPCTTIVNGDFYLHVDTNSHHYRFGLSKGWKEGNLSVRHLFNFRTPRYTQKQLEHFNHYFPELCLYTVGSDYFLGLPDGRGHYTLTPYILTENENPVFFGYYIYESFGDGDSRQDPQPDLLYLGKITDVSKTGLDFEFS